eukprot:CAMPEP_0168293196 /NCGR_PEP_ID=MMETSP0142_2-20121227/7728_1 /TAXON_ID=44445 /ORGANISM="Pseudo-nitzschia australis, Strain 10249 10 AB" /LENGTH=995 /DNA_ID=CAMNT_0008241223 /DNA_START=72 /DNA_END=3059 /DNA_ORIENTATION=+
MPALLYNRRRRRGKASSACSLCPEATKTKMLFWCTASNIAIAAAICGVTCVDAMAPPYPELLEESRKYRELHESLFPNISYSSLPSLPSGIWESTFDYRQRQQQQQQQQYRQLQLLRKRDRDLESAITSIERNPAMDADKAATASASNSTKETQHFSNEICRFLDDNECEEIETSFMNMASKTRANIVRMNKNDGSSTSDSDNTIFNSSDSSGVDADVGNNEKPKYTLRTLVILVAWKDQEERREWMPRDRVDHLWNGIGADDEIPTGSIKNYTERQAYGTVNFVADVLEWQTIDNTEAFYANGRAGRPGPTEPMLRTAFHNILDTMDAEGFPWDDYDSNNDGIIDHVQFLHTGYGAEIGGIDCYTKAPMMDRIWSHAMPESRGKWVSPTTGKKLGGWSTSSVFSGKCDKNIAQLGIMVHEFYHTLGLPDLYDRDQPYAAVKGVGGLGGLGIFCMMACPFGSNNNQKFLGSLSPWGKMDVGFIAEPIEITHNGTYTARPSNDFADIFSIRRGFPEGEKLLLENRQNTGFDSSLWAGGMLIYKVEETGGHNGNQRHGFPGQIDAPEEGDAWPSNGLHYPIALLQADGRYDLETGINNGDVEDFYRYPDQKLMPGNGELIATDEGTYPNSDSYALGDIKRTGIVIDNFQEAEDGSGVFTFRVTFPDNETEILLESPSPSTTTTNIPSTHPAKFPIQVPTQNPTSSTINISSKIPTKLPTQNPTSSTTNISSKIPTRLPTQNPTKDSAHPSTNVPSKIPTRLPTQNPTQDSAHPSTNIPSKIPTKLSTHNPNTGSKLSTKAPRPARTDPPTQSLLPSESDYPTENLLDNEPIVSEQTGAPFTKAPEKAIPVLQPPVGMQAPTTTYPTISSAPSSSFTPTSECNGILDVGITTDSNPHETTWEILSAATSRYVTGFGLHNDNDTEQTKTLEEYTEYHWKICVLFSEKEPALLFRIHDTGKDGLQPPGKYSVSMDGVLIASGGPFPDGSQTIEFSTAQSG